MNMQSAQKIIKGFKDYYYFNNVPNVHSLATIEITLLQALKIVLIIFITIKHKLVLLFIYLRVHG